MAAKYRYASVGRYGRWMIERKYWIFWDPLTWTTSEEECLAVIRQDFSDQNPSWKYWSEVHLGK